ncbi:MAG: arginine decarboxylase, partial [Oscillochloris sp.]|nr:arginine decarboxylase [Oscillochloris sp.]
MGKLKHQIYAEYMKDRHGFSGEGRLTDFLTRENDQLLLGGRANLNELAQSHGAPLEVVYTPQITTQVERMRTWAEQARGHSEYQGAFLYAYATKANFAAEAVETALAAGAHYEA